MDLNSRIQDRNPPVLVGLFSLSRTQTHALGEIRQYQSRGWLWARTQGRSSDYDPVRERKESRDTQELKSKQYNVRLNICKPTFLVKRYRYVRRYNLTFRSLTFDSCPWYRVRVRSTSHTDVRSRTGSQYVF